MWVFEWVFGWFGSARDELDTAFFYEWSQDNLFDEWEEDNLFNAWQNDNLFHEWTDRR
jgi:hypothetical protein